MKTLLSLLLLLSTVIPTSFAQQSGLISAIEELPPCALRCLTTAIGQSPCQLTDQTCICTNAQLQSSVEVCVLQNCTIKQGLTTKNITSTTCNAPIRDRVQEFRTINVVFGVISAACVLARLVYKGVFTAAELGWDDYLILATLLSGVPSTIISDRGTLENGLGRDIWTVQFWQITKFVRFLYIMEVLYFLQIALLKLSLLFFFLRIFPARPVKRIIWATIFFDILYASAFIIAGIFQCRPVSYYWDRWDGEHKGKCVNINALGWSNAAISITLDIWMLAIPLSQVFHLKLAWKKKIGVALMFFVGTFVTVVSIIRLQSLVHFANSNNPTWDQWDLINWSTIEINVGMMCACMPAIRVILVRLFPKVFGTTRSSSNQYYAKYGSRSRSHSRGLGKHPIDSGGTGNSGSSGSRMGKESKLSLSGKEIKYTKTFEVHHHHHYHPDNDEVQLVPMDDLSAKGAKVTSHNSSQNDKPLPPTPLPRHDTPPDSP